MQKHDGGDEACSTRAYVSDPVIARTRASYCACALAAPAQVPDKWMSTVVSPLCALCITNGAHYRHFIDSVPWHTNSGFPYSPRRAVTWKLTEGRAYVYLPPLNILQPLPHDKVNLAQIISSNPPLLSSTETQTHAPHITTHHPSSTCWVRPPTPFYTRYQTSHPTILELLTTHMFVSEIYRLHHVTCSSVNSSLYYVDLDRWELPGAMSSLPSQVRRKDTLVLVHSMVYRCSYDNSFIITELL